MVSNLGTTGSHFKNCWFPNFGTSASQSHKHGFPLRGTASSPAFEPMLPSLGTAGSQFKELNHCFSILEPRPPARGTDDSHLLEPWNRGVDGSHMLEPMIPNLGTTRSELEKLAVPRRWNQCFPILEPRVPSSRNKQLPYFWSVGTHGFQFWNHGFPVWRTAASQTLEPILPNLETTGSQFEELLVPKPGNLCFPILEPRVSSLRNYWFLNLGPMRPNLFETRNC